MKLTPSTALRAFRRLLPVALCLAAMPAPAQSRRETNAGAILFADVNKSLTRHFDLALGEEMRLVSHSGRFDRSVTTAGLDYAFWNRKIKLGAYYELLYTYNSDYRYEARHRYYFNLAYRETLARFTLSWRGRVQGTYRNENRGDYRINPKYVLKNRFQAEYSFWGRPWKPFVFCELSGEMNNPAGNELIRARWQGGASWRLNRTDYVDFFIRYDRPADAREAQVVSFGAGYKLKL